MRFSVYPAIFGQVHSSLICCLITEFVKLLIVDTDCAPKIRKNYFISYMYLNVFSDINCWWGDSCLSIAAINLLHCLNLHPCARSTVNCTKIPPLSLCCWFSKRLSSALVVHSPILRHHRIYWMWSTVQIPKSRGLLEYGKRQLIQNFLWSTWKILPIVKIQYIKTPDQSHFFFKYNNSATLTLWLLFSDSPSNAKRHITQPINQTVTVT